MVKAQQIEKDGTPFGIVKTFTDVHWARMVANYGKKLRWKLIEEEEVIYPEEEIPVKNEILEEIPFDPYGKTKREIVDHYRLPEEDMKLNRDELINKVVE